MLKTKTGGGITRYGEQHYALRSGLFFSAYPISMMFEGCYLSSSSDIS